MNFEKVGFLILLSFLYVSSYDLCRKKDGSECSVLKTSTLSESECSQITFYANKQSKNDLANIYLRSNTNKDNILLNITFKEPNWKKGYLKLSDYDNKNIIACKMYTNSIKDCVPNQTKFFDNCLNPKKYEIKDYLLEFKSDTERSVAYKKLLFRPLSDTVFEYRAKNNNVTITSVFSYIDITNTFELILHIQAVPESLNVSYFQVEVLKEKSGEDELLDIRMIPIDSSDEYIYKFVTYNDEGFYYFKISLINQLCPENFCLKTTTPKVYISKKGTPLVIGIVGASFIIPFVLFLLHMMTRRYQKQEEILESKEKILFIFKAHPEGHKDVVYSLAKIIESLTSTEVLFEPVNLIRSKQKEPERWCSDSLLLATHIFYICGPDEFKMDYMTYSFLLEETRKCVQEKDIFVIKFPYSFKEVPKFLSKCIVLDVPDDTKNLLNRFKNDLETNLENNIEYISLYNKIRKLKTDMKSIRIPLQMPTIIITEQSDNENSSDGNPRDSLL